MWLPSLTGVEDESDQCRREWATGMNRSVCVFASMLQCLFWLSCYQSFPSLEETGLYGNVPTLGNKPTSHFRDELLNISH